MTEEIKHDECEVICNNCVGNLNLIDVQTNKVRLFSKVFFKRVTFMCDICKKTTKYFTKKILIK